MLRRTLTASAVALFMAAGSGGVQANPVTDMISALINDTVTVQNEARRGGGARRSSSVRRPSASYNRSSSTTAKSNTQNTQQSQQAQTQNKTQQQDASFTQRSNQSSATPATANNNMGTQTATQSAGGLGMGANFVSSLAGAGAGVLLANMLLSPAAAAEQGTEIATPDMLSDDQISECLTTIDADIKDAEKRLSEAADEDKQAIRDELSQMRNLKITLMQEQINRMQAGS